MVRPFEAGTFLSFFFKAYKVATSETEIAAHVEASGTCMIRITNLKLLEHVQCSAKQNNMGSNGLFVGGCYASAPQSKREVPNGTTKHPYKDRRMVNWMS